MKKVIMFCAFAIAVHSVFAEAVLKKIDGTNKTNYVDGTTRADGTIEHVTTASNTVYKLYTQNNVLSPSLQAVPTYAFTNINEFSVMMWVKLESLSGGPITRIRKDEKSTRATLPYFPMVYYRTERVKFNKSMYNYYQALSFKVEDDGQKANWIDSTLEDSWNFIYWNFKSLEDRQEITHKTISFNGMTKSCNSTLEPCDGYSGFGSYTVMFRGGIGATNSVNAKFFGVNILQRGLSNQEILTEFSNGKKEIIKQGL